MIENIYVEKHLKDHPRVTKILERFNKANIIETEHYGEVFNLKAQNFRLQKQNPALILAEKTGKKVLPTPEGFGVGGTQNFYFSHMLNCLYDCRYCFLQGMYNSANYVLFVNYEDFMDEISQITDNATEPCYFFSGYDCDSMALDSVTNFLDEFLPFFAKTPKAILELRTKSVKIDSLLKYQPFDNLVAAFSFTPHEISQNIEHKVPPVKSRIAALQKLANHGWKIGLRFDPLIHHENFGELYKGLINEIFKGLKTEAIHSISIGPLRFPNKMYQKIKKLYPEDELFQDSLAKREETFSYQKELEQEMEELVRKELSQYLPKTMIFKCNAL